MRKAIQVNLQTLIQDATERRFEDAVDIASSLTVPQLKKLQNFINKRIAAFAENNGVMRQMVGIADSVRWREGAEFERGTIELLVPNENAVLIVRRNGKKVKKALSEIEKI